MKQFYITKRSRPLIGTFVEINVYAEKDDRTQEIIDQAFDLILTFESIFSFYREDSILSFLNYCTPKEPFQIPVDLYLLLKYCRKFSSYSEGIFDITAEQVPYRDYDDNIGNWQDIILCPNYSVYFRKPVQINLGGIAKGFIVDKTAKFLHRKGICNALINAGGDLRVYGNYLWPLAIRHPTETYLSVPLFSQKNISIASSSITEEAKFRGGKSSATLHPQKKHNKFKNKIVHVTIISNCCTTADALTTICLLNLDVAMFLIKKTNSQALLCDENGQWFATKNFNDSFYEQETKKITTIL